MALASNVPVTAATLALQATFTIRGHARHVHPPASIVRLVEYAHRVSLDILLINSQDVFPLPATLLALHAGIRQTSVISV